VAYTLVSYKQVIYCDYYFTTAPALPAGCWRNSQATTTLHENTHLAVLYSPGTDDIAYSKSEVTALSATQSLMNAECYEQYAAGKFRWTSQLRFDYTLTHNSLQAIMLGC